MAGIVETESWASETFGECELGDPRRTRRLMQVAQRILEHPAGSFPDQMPDWAELKAAYRLFDAEKVTLHAVAMPHWQHTRNAATGKTLVICDTTELNFGSDREGLGRTGNGAGRGFLLHNALMVDGLSRAVVGVAGQAIHYRPKCKRAKQNSSQALKRKRESQVGVRSSTKSARQRVTHNMFMSAIAGRTTSRCFVIFCSKAATGSCVQSTSGETCSCLRAKLCRCRTCCLTCPFWEPTN